MPWRIVPWKIVPWKIVLWKIVLWVIVLWTIVCMEISLGISLGKSAVAAVSQAVAAWEGTLLHP